MLTLPTFELLAPQPKKPHTAQVVARKVVPNQHGAEIVYTVWRSRKGRDWWVSASLHGHRMSNTLHTTVAARGEEWRRAVEAGEVELAP
jgi:hypothetical protein